MTEIKPWDERPLAQGEPVAWFIDVTTNGKSTGDWQVAARENWGDLSVCQPLYLQAQPAREPMTPEQIDELMDHGNKTYSPLKFVRAVEAHHGIGEKK